MGRALAPNPHRGATVSRPSRRVAHPYRGRMLEVIPCADERDEQVSLDVYNAVWPHAAFTLDGGSLVQGERARSLRRRRAARRNRSRLRADRRPPSARGPRPHDRHRARGAPPPGHRHRALPGALGVDCGSTGSTRSRFLPWTTTGEHRVRDAARASSRSVASSASCSSSRDRARPNSSRLTGSRSSAGQTGPSSRTGCTRSRSRRFPTSPASRTTSSSRSRTGSRTTCRARATPGGDVRRGRGRRGGRLREVRAHRRAADGRLPRLSGVKRAWRGRGVARALKTAQIRWAIANGYDGAPHPQRGAERADPPLNASLGYRPGIGRVYLVGPLAGP